MSKIKNPAALAGLRGRTGEYQLYTTEGYYQKIAGLSNQGEKIGSLNGLFPIAPELSVIIVNALEKKPMLLFNTAAYHAAVGREAAMR